jgi:hypothetical protein
LWSCCLWSLVPDSRPASLLLLSRRNTLGMRSCDKERTEETHTTKLWKVHIFNCTSGVSFFLNFWDGARLGPMVQQLLMGLLCQSWMKEECLWDIWQWNTKVLREKPVPAPLCLPQIPYGLISHQSWISMVSSWSPGLWHNKS